MFHVPENCRKILPIYPKEVQVGNNGAFDLRLKDKTKVFAIASKGMGWEHVSVSTPTRALIWDEMCEVKAIFWDEEDCVVQYHPPKSEYVNMSEHCLHLWRPTDEKLPMPPSIMVGLKGVKIN